MVLIVGLWILLIIYGVTHHSSENIFGDNSLRALRGICAVEIMLGHIGVATDNLVLYPNRKAGILVVGIFFMLSGYGISYCECHGKNISTSL